jgi:Fur family ferric uptake transcriptional regulator
VTRRTSQRRAILHALHEAPGPLTPQEVHRRARREQASLGLATVYRNLARLEEAGEVEPVHLPDDVTRYEPAGRGHHHHFRCRGCGRVFELDADCPVAILEGLTLPGGFRVEGHALTLYGRCAACRARGDEAAPAAASSEGTRAADARSGASPEDGPRGAGSSRRWRS